MVSSGQKFIPPTATSCNLIASLWVRCPLPKSSSSCTRRSACCALLAAAPLKLHRSKAIDFMQAAGSFHGHALYGIRKFSVQAPRLQSIVEDCAAAAKSNDARDKYFATYVSEFASCSSKSLRSELPSLEVGALQHTTVSMTCGVTLSARLCRPRALLWLR